MVVGSSGLVFLGGRFSWLLAFGIGAGLLIVLAWVHQRHLRARAVRGEEAVPAVRPPPEALSAKLAHIRRAYSSFLFQPQALLVIAFLMTYKMGDVLMFSMSKVLLARELGVPTDVRGVLNSLSLGASILGAILGGAFIARRSLKGALMTITLWMALTAPLFALLAAFAPELRIAVPGSVQDASGLVWSQAWPGLSCICTVIVIEQVCGGMATAAQVVFIMQRTAPEHRAAHYAFATAVYSLPQTLVGASSGKLYEAFGPVAYFWFVSVLMLPAIVLGRLVPCEPPHETRPEPSASV
jgi:PAT family beta-lactamase induction signal transducer AmpG